MDSGCDNEGNTNDDGSNYNRQRRVLIVLKFFTNRKGRGFYDNNEGNCKEYKPNRNKDQSRNDIVG